MQSSAKPAKRAMARKQHPTNIQEAIVVQISFSSSGSRALMINSLCTDRLQRRVSLKTSITKHHLEEWSFSSISSASLMPNAYKSLFFHRWKRDSQQQLSLKTWRDRHKRLCHKQHRVSNSIFDAVWVVHLFFARLVRKDLGASFHGFYPYSLLSHKETPSFCLESIITHLYACHPTQNNCMIEQESCTRCAVAHHVLSIQPFMAASLGFIELEHLRLLPKFREFVQVFCKKWQDCLWRRGIE